MALQMSWPHFLGIQPSRIVPESPEIRVILQEKTRSKPSDLDGAKFGQGCKESPTLHQAWRWRSPRTASIWVSVDLEQQNKKQGILWHCHNSGHSLRCTSLSASPLLKTTGLASAQARFRFCCQDIYHSRRFCGLRSPLHLVSLLMQAHQSFGCFIFFPNSPVQFPFGNQLLKAVTRSDPLRWFQFISSRVIFLWFACTVMLLNERSNE